MRNIDLKKICALKSSLLFILCIGFLPQVHAQAGRTVPFDVYLIVDASVALQQPRAEIMAWIDEQVIDRLLIDGDSITVWSAGAKAAIIHNAVISGDASKGELRARLQALQAGGQNADFSGALADAVSRLAQRGQDRSRIPHTLLITASAEALSPAFTAAAGHHFRWFRTEHSSRWQALVIAPTIAPRVQQAAAAYMNSQQ
ncbi:MAG: hypothetical protein FWD91_00310 [Treponema sp.]|nr:hypothetical protein [Treponema sp.]